MGAPQPGGHANGRAGHDLDHDAGANAPAEPDSHAPAHESFAHAGPHQPVTVPGGVRAEPVTIGGIAGANRLGIR